MTVEKIDEMIKEIIQKKNDPNLCKGTVACSSRISGYYRNLNAWNDGKRQEWTERAEYSIV